MNLFKNITYFILSLQEKILVKRLNKTIGIKNSSGRKQLRRDGCFLCLSSLADEQKEKMEEEIMLILKTSNYTPEEVLEYIKKHDTDVFYIKKTDYLNSIGEHEGFICPQKGAKALYLNLLLSSKFSLRTKQMFVVKEGEINKYYFIYNFYNWYAYNHNIEGLDNEAQDLLKKFIYSNNDEDFNKLQLADIYKLKDAIKQDKAALSFVIKLCQNYDGAKNALEKLKNDGASL